MMLVLPMLPVHALQRDHPHSSYGLSCRCGFDMIVNFSGTTALQGSYKRYGADPLPALRLFASIGGSLYVEYIIYKWLVRTGLHYDVRS